MNSQLTLVFIHGTAGHSSDFSVQCEYFEKFFQCLSVDLKGNTLEEWVEETDKVLTAHARPDQFYFLVGHSLGGLVALSLAAQPSTYTLKGIALIDTLMLVPAEVKPSLSTLRTALESEAYSEVLSEFVNTYFVSSVDEVEARTALVARILEFPKEKFLPLWAASEDYDAEPEIKKITIPLLYLHCGVPTDLNKLESLLPGLAKVMRMAKPGHYPHVFSAEETNRALKEFIENHLT